MCGFRIYAKTSSKYEEKRIWNIPRKCSLSPGCKAHALWRESIYHVKK